VLHKLASTVISGCDGLCHRRLDNVGIQHETNSGQCQYIRKAFTASETVHNLTMFVIYLRYNPDFRRGGMVSKAIFIF
jgi:hypothetical protein